MRILQINTTVNSGSTGRIAEDIGHVLKANGHESYIAFGRGDRPSKSELVRIGAQKDVLLHGVKTALFDRHGFGSTFATKRLIDQIKNIKPDLIALHNLHGYYLNIEVLFHFLSSAQIPVVWTLFDCWAFTGHCTYFDDVQCERWKSGCHDCPKTKRYPASYLLDNSKRNYREKSVIFNSVKNMTLIVHSDWLRNLVRSSFLNAYDTQVIRSGVDLGVFRPMTTSVREKFNLGSGRILLGCASVWDKRKGLHVFHELSELISHDQKIVLVGLSEKQRRDLPANIIGIPRTESTEELASLYSEADVFVNPTFQDNFPTTNLESLACGTPIVTFDTGGSREAIDAATGVVVAKGDTKEMRKAIDAIIGSGKSTYSNACRDRATRLFDKATRYQDYINLFNDLIDKK